MGVIIQVIFTNESNIDRWKNKRQKAVDSKIGRLNNFIKLVKVPIQVKKKAVNNFSWLHRIVVLDFTPSQSLLFASVDSME